MDRIKFSGELSQESKNYILRQNHKVSIVIWLLMFVTMSTILLFIGYKAKIIIFLIPFIVLLAIFVLIIIIFPNLDTPPKKMEQYYPINVNISEDEISFENISFDSYCCRKILDIKRILDCGNFYYIKFYFPYNHNCVCQKNLISYGTIEEFEQIFEGKIVRKR